MAAPPCQRAHSSHRHALISSFEVIYAWVQKLRNISASPLNLSRSQRPTPSTERGSGPSPPSVYCHSIHLSQLTGTTAVGPYCASQNQHCDSTGSWVLPRSSFT